LFVTFALSLLDQSQRVAQVLVVHDGAWKNVRVFWKRLRGSALWGAPSLHGGIGILLHAAVSGMHWFVGVASPDARIARGELDGTAIFGGASAALLFLP
jgi:hypothetical protein